MIEPCIPLLVSECLLLALAYNVPRYNTQARLLVQTSSHGTWRAGAHSLSLYNIPRYQRYNCTNIYISSGYHRASDRERKVIY